MLLSFALFFGCHFLFSHPTKGVRFGEADNPGPCNTVDLGTLNPTQLLNKEDTVCEWGQGIYTAAETSVTPVARQILTHKFRSQQRFTWWSEDVAPQKPSVSQIRGRAAGTAVISSFPLKPYLEPLPSILESSTRFCETVAQVTCNCVLYCAVLYGFHESNAYVDPIKMNNQLFTPIAERSLNFQGPACISGDFNCELHKLVAWDSLRKAGWCDAAELDGHLHARQPQPTCREATRKSFILINPKLAARLISCRTCEDYAFSTHPLLLARIDLPTLIQPQLQWVLPKSVDDFHFDAALQLDQVHRELATSKNAFARALETNSADKAASILANIVQSSWKHSCVDVAGHHQYLKPGHFQRDSIKPLQSKQSAIPLNKKGRDGDFEPIGGQVTVELRRHTRQARRLESLVSQLQSCERTECPNAQNKCQTLWEAILAATGFRRSFAHWVGQHLGWFVPLTCPHLDVKDLKEHFIKWHSHQQHEYFLLRQRHRRMSVALDVESGGSASYREIRDPPMAPLTYVVQQAQTNVRKARWTKKGNRILKVDSIEGFYVGSKVTFQNQHSTIVSILPNTLVVDKPFVLRSQDYCIRQQHAIADPDQMQELVAEAWNVHWRRDPPHTHIDEDYWQHVEPLLGKFPDIPKLAFSDLTLDAWKTNCKGLNKKSARGACGFSVGEMIQFPDPIIELVLAIYNAVEHGMPWPKSWVLARVTMLSKCDCPMSPYDARPITVFSVLYRQWSRIRSRQIFAFMASYMPREIAAATNRIPAEAVAALVAHLAETAINTGVPLSGVGIDLQRCFNTIPRKPVLLALLKCGVPQPYLTAWEAMLNDMGRTLAIGGHHSTIHNSTTGAPEGCGMSVVAMSALTYWFGCFIKCNHPTSRPIGFADNWNLLHDNPATLRLAIDDMVQFVQDLKLTINPKKSWIWSTSPNHRKSLRGTRINGVLIPVVCNTSDLGCDIHYSQKRVLKKGTKRWSKARRVCLRIAQYKGPRHFRAKMAKGAGFASAAYGTPLQTTSVSSWKKLRSSLAKALHLNTAGGSPWLALAANGLDPQLISLGRTCRFWRKFLDYFPQTREDFHHNVITCGISKVGPAVCFRRSLAQAGWKFLSPNTIEHPQAGIQLNWQNSSKKFMQHAFQHAWTWTVVKNIPNRKNWTPRAFDTCTYQRLVKDRPSNQTALLLGATAGKHYTNDVIHKYDKDVNPACPFCGSPDGVSHRLFECSEFSAIRQPFRKTITWAKQQDLTLQFLALPAMPTTIWSLLCPLAPREVEIVFPSPSRDRIQLFLDGSAFCQEHRHLCVSSWAVVQATQLQRNFWLVDSGFTPTIDQSSYRGEVSAILKGLQHAYRCVLHSDCLAAVNVLLELREAASQGKPFPEVDHKDLWYPIWLLVSSRPIDCVEVVKVDAHKQSAQIRDPLKQWQSYGNNFVDLHAKKVITGHPIYSKLMKLKTQYETSCSHLHAYHELMCSIGEAALTKTKVVKPQAGACNLPNFDEWGPHGPTFQVCLLSLDQLPQRCPYGDIFYQRIYDWFCRLRWPRHPERCTPLSVVGICELYWNFVVCSGTESPINTSSTRTPVWELLDHNPLLQAKHIPLATHTKTWVNFWKWDAPLSPLTHIGFSLRANCFSLRPEMPHSVATYRSMWDYFHQRGGRRRSFDAPLRPLPHS